MQTAFKQPDGSVKWVNYQNLPNLAGDRKIQDRQKFIEEDFKDASVLDLGCWGGQMMLEAKRLGAKEVQGIEIDRDAIKLGRELGLNILRDDLENPFLWKSLDNYDVILCLAILGNMKNKIAVLTNASPLAKVMYVEGHGKQYLFSRADWMDLFLTYTSFKTIEYIGDVTTRPLFRLSREEKTIDYIKSKNYKRIALIGKPGAGKTFLTKYFPEYIIYTDTEKGLIGDRIVVDSHGALTLSNFDCVINVIADLDIRKKRISERAETTEDSVSNFSDTISPLYVKGEYDFFTISNN
jgi:hypothetical protein